MKVKARSFSLSSTPIATFFSHKNVVLQLCPEPFTIFTIDVLKFNSNVHSLRLKLTPKSAINHKTNFPSLWFSQLTTSQRGNTTLNLGHRESEYLAYIRLAMSFPISKSEQYFRILIFGWACRRYDVTVWNRTKGKCEPLISLGAKWVFDF